MQKTCDEWLILGFTEKGKTSGPSDWADLLCGAFAYYSNNKRWTYSDHVYPILHEGITSVRVHSTFQTADLIGYQFVMNFAQSNQLKLIALAEEPADLIKTADTNDVARSVREFTFALLLHHWKTNAAWRRYKKETLP